MHAAALEQLKVATLAPRVDKQDSVRVLLPDAGNWRRVRFWGVESLVGFRYGKDHHAIVAAFVTHVPDNTESGACTKSFEAWAKPWMEAFDVDVSHEPPVSVIWRREPVSIDALVARSATLTDRETYTGAYAAYPAWPGACLIVGIAVPARDQESRARDVRDRFAKEVLPYVEVLTTSEPKERY